MLNALGIMDVPDHRRWIDNRKENGGITSEFMNGVGEFIEFLEGQPNFNPAHTIRCPCKKCKCLRFHDVTDVMQHLFMKGFMPNYYYWTCHGESLPPTPPMVVEHAYYGVGAGREEFNYME